MRPFAICVSSRQCWLHLSTLSSFAKPHHQSPSHGPKWQYELGDHPGNFQTANDFLMGAMDLSVALQ